MKRVLTAIVLIAIVFSLIFWGNQYALITFSALIACLAAFEYDGLTKAGGYPVPQWWMLPAIVLFFLMVDYRPLVAPLPMFSFLGLLLFVYAAFAGDLKQALPTAAIGSFGLIYIAYPLSLIPVFAQMENGIALLLFLMLTVWTGDTAALYVGRSFGKHKLAPRLSPGKTWEGAIASVLGSVLVAALLVLADYVLSSHGFAQLHISEPLWQTLILAALVNTAAQIGDLLESAIKRGVGVKDSGTLLPGHGGILDRIDALLVAAPVLMFLINLKEAAGLGIF